jgi:hypothetical protein
VQFYALEDGRDIGHEGVTLTDGERSDVADVLASAASAWIEARMIDSEIAARAVGL